MASVAQGMNQRVYAYTYPGSSPRAAGLSAGLQALQLILGNANVVAGGVFDPAKLRAALVDGLEEPAALAPHMGMGFGPVGEAALPFK